jgi:iron complex transport system ATP-binding protein
MTALLQIDRATVLRDGRALLDGLSLRIDAGEHTAILGPNGSGKSTLVKLIERRIYPLARSAEDEPIYIFGQARWNVAELRQLIGVVSADLRRDFDGIEGLRVREVVLSGFFSSFVLGLDHEATAAMHEATDEALERLGIAHLAERDIATLSTGESRRVLIARALVFRPRALLLDEPCTGLDLGARRDFLEHLRKLAQTGTTLLLVTHHIEEILPEIAHIVLLRDGRVFASGAKDGLLHGTPLSELFGLPLTVARDGDWYSARVA